MQTLGLKNINLLTKEQFDGIETPATDELYAVSGSGYGFPSDRYIDLEVGASNTIYTAPANGWFRISGSATGNGAFIALINQTKSIPAQGATGTAKGNALYTNVVARKNDEVLMYYANIDAASIVLKFVYAEGEE
jgi:hypothetical protein